MKILPKALMSRRRLMCIGVAAAAGVVAGCGGAEKEVVKVSTSEQGSPSR